MIMLMNTVILFDDYVPDDHSAWTCSLSQDKVSIMLLMIMLQCQRQGEATGQIGQVVQTVLTNSKVCLGGLD